MSMSSVNVVLVMGPSGTGKSTSIRNLNPKETFIINVLNKPLPFPGYRKNYIPVDATFNNGNYYASDTYEQIIHAIDHVSRNRKEIKNLIIDDFQYTMANEFMRNASLKGYEKFTDIGKHAWGIINKLTNCRATLNCFVLTHSEDDGNGSTKCKTIGKMLDEKVILEGMVAIIMHTKIVDKKYKFITNHDGYHMARSPMGMFDSDLIDNDLAYVVKCIEAHSGAETADLLGTITASLENASTEEELKEKYLYLMRSYPEYADQIIEIKDKKKLSLNKESANTTMSEKQEAA